MLLLTYSKSYSEEPFRSSPPFDQSVSCSYSSMAASISSHQELCYTVNKIRIYENRQSHTLHNHFSISNHTFPPSTENCTQQSFCPSLSLTFCKLTRTDHINEQQVFPQCRLQASKYMPNYCSLLFN